ncbi:hypothetical protein BZA05DRAFT_393358 [Tricharina praecox]|uniref:uncharacterized protein n=1 Tax=Tricharina praecox TaxID=43433 RepID=UPI00221EEFEB|nr:uncharacterized protein BZA05DRAFT_393358 [Tricharina praecox]KAI5854146.1 hypothetical protein BZA05DRAFT_393358 [Tricharina praecox]
MSLINFYRSLPPRTRAILGGAVVVYATVGLYVSDFAEEKLGFTPSEQEKAQISGLVPKVRVVDRVDRTE